MPDATALDPRTLALVRLAAAVAAGDESALRLGMGEKMVRLPRRKATARAISRAITP